MSKKILHILIFLSATVSFLAAQKKMNEGTVTYVSSMNVYAKFSNTENLKANDTLYSFKNNDYSPSAIIKSKSTVSVVAQILNKTTFKINDKIYFEEKKKKDEQEINTPLKEAIPNEVANTDVLQSSDSIQSSKVTKQKELKSSYSGRFTASTNSSISDREDFQRVRLAFNSTFNNIKGSKFSFNNYVTFRHRYGVDQNATDFYDDFKVYSLAVNYNLNPNAHITVGRQINNKIANIGAIDGIQFDGQKSTLLYGVFAGSRPDVFDYRFNPKLLQGGLYIGHDKLIGKGSMQTTLAFAEQRNDGNVDRRFAYIQHNFTAIKSVQIFGSIEMDMYQKINDTITNNLNLTSAYFSLRYKPTKRLSITTSYDNRRNVIFYESNRLFIDQLVNQETRQGLRLMLQYQLMKNINISGSGFYRYQKSFESPTKNYVANVHFSRFLSTPLMLNINYNILSTQYFDGTILGGRANYDLMKGKLQLELNYRKVAYQFNLNEQKLDQNIFGGSISIQIKKMTTLMVNYEGTFEPNSIFHRYFVTAMQRFKSK